jgi:hypothetical protein
MVNVAAAQERHEKARINERACGLAGRLEVLFPPRAQVAREAIDRANNVPDGIEQCRLSPARSLCRGQSLAYHIGFR